MHGERHRLLAWCAERRPPPEPGHQHGPALSVERLGKRFGERIAFEDVSFEVARGEVFGFLGPNGSGKTTTVRTLGTLLTPTSGSATVAGLALEPENGVRIRSRIAIMPESPGLYARLSVAENLAFFAGLHQVADAADRIAEVLAAVNLTDRAKDLCGALSKGLRQRVSLARALLNDPQVLFLDEPTSGLDPVAAHDVEVLLDRLRDRGVTVFLTTQPRPRRRGQGVARVSTQPLNRRRHDDHPPGVPDCPTGPGVHCQQGTLEPVLTTPVRRDEFLLGKFLAALAPSIVVSYVVFALVVVIIAVLADPDSAAAVLRGSAIIVQLVFTPLVAAWSIWLGIAIFARASDIRTAQQVALPASLPTVAVALLIALNVIPATVVTACLLAAALVGLNVLGWRASAALLDPERLITT